MSKTAIRINLFFLLQDKKIYKKYKSIIFCFVFRNFLFLLSKFQGCYAPKNVDLLHHTHDHTAKLLQNRPFSKKSLKSPKKSPKKSAEVSHRSVLLVPV